ncbi:chorismate-binding protein, partial [Francisella tularensis]|uniref:chorismate-binding protein n=1 Tax=Francisella tularensis TaxID=263 RepID=UPI0023819FC3
LQMPSQISAKVDKQISFRKILDGLFPCGSITGDPKKRTMELIKQIEKCKRGVYTGSIGYIMPNNDICFNVAIRTIQKYRDNL